ncbi:MAG: asparagine synthase (glutamine-hydrolyzing), partial [Bdellovibrionota bacterium]|nr:asparagine synthase (glutamine-hydrolyzing) [Bdellovibrionota bacterium]
GHTRLSIIDLDNGTQPIVDETGQYTICFNGEIYNYKELKEELYKMGLPFSTNSDTEVLLKGYIHWKEKVVEKIQGMFAFSIWDNEKKQLFCARDPLGQKPFYYTIKNNRFYFSSEASTFKGIDGVSNNLSSSAIYSFLNDEAFHGDSTIYSDVKKLEEGHYILWSKEINKKVKFFNSIPGKVEIESPTISGLKQLLVKHVSMTNRADVPTSLLLSGGLDSSLVLALLRDSNKDKEITSYHVNVKDKTFNETYYAKEAARLHNSKLIEIPLDLMSLSGLAMKMPEELDLPQSDPGILPKYLISKEIAKNHKVSLTGDGADELFYGYLIFKAFKMYSYYKYVPNFIQDYMVKPAFGVFKEGSGYMNKGFIFKRFLDGIKGSEHGLSNRWKHGLSNQELESALNKDLL